MVSLPVHVTEVQVNGLLDHSVKLGYCIELGEVRQLGERRQLDIDDNGDSELRVERVNYGLEVAWWRIKD